MAQEWSSQETFDEAIISLPVLNERSGLNIVGYLLQRISVDPRYYNEHWDDLLQMFLLWLRMLAGRELDGIDNDPSEKNDPLFLLHSEGVIIFLERLLEEGYARDNPLLAETLEMWRYYMPKPVDQLAGRQCKTTEPR